MAPAATCSCISYELKYIKAKDLADRLAEVFGGGGGGSSSAATARRR